MPEGWCSSLFPVYIEYARVAVLLSCLTLAGYRDVKSREVSDRLWIVMGLAGGVLLLLGDSSAGLLALLTDALVVFFVLEHFVTWEDYLQSGENLPLVIEVGIYIMVVAFVTYGYLDHSGIVTSQVLAIVATVIISRALFEARLLYGGADAKALMASAVVLPLLAAPFPFLVTSPGYVQSTLLSIMPLPITMLIDGAILTLFIPLGIFAYNLRRGYHEFPEAFFLYEIPTEELPRKFVWLRKPLPEGDEDVETAEDDRELRKSEARRLKDLGIDRVYVTPQLPMVAALAAGAVLAVLVGNVLFLLM
ncbi:MAG: hypothetical protein M1144_00435 [Candidatus Thermoplasmatota archaeon]|jgi:Flp pilus assembly protein protease CpaA|nr:hypothetical protein [Candidatus Thermoplasmatota archaeon]MCL5984346.1 hypothetical protein [Candidatus Thermoplasmatota archaeon]